MLLLIPLYSQLTALHRVQPSLEATLQYILSLECSFHIRSVSPLSLILKLPFPTLTSPKHLQHPSIPLTVSSIPLPFPLTLSTISQFPLRFPNISDLSPYFPLWLPLIIFKANQSFLYLPVNSTSISPWFLHSPCQSQYFSYSTSQIASSSHSIPRLFHYAPDLVLHISN